jgi:hypothetical protein
MRFHPSLAALAAAAALACTEGDPPTAVGPTLDVTAAAERIGGNESFPIAFETFSPCTGEPVLLSGSVHESWSVTFDETGGGRYSSHFNFQGVGGEGPSGTRYRAINVGNSHQTFAYQPPYSYFSNQTLLFVAQGDAPDFRVHAVFHVMVDENYQQQVLVDRYTAECSGADAADRVTRAATGHANLTQGGELRTFSFAAIQHADGRVTGEWELNNRATNTRLHGAVTCLTVIGNRAWIGGITEQSNNPGTVEGRGVFWRVVDNGEGANDPPDETSLTFTNLAAGVPELRCRNMPLPVVMPIEAGNITVR